MEKVAALLLVVFQFSGFSSVNSSPIYKCYLSAIDTSVLDTATQKTLQITGKKTLKGAFIDWSSFPSSDVKEINLLLSNNGKTFSPIYTIKSGVSSYVDEWASDKSIAYYKLEVFWKDGSSATSNTVLVSAASLTFSITLITNPVIDVAKLKIVSAASQLFMAEWRNSQGIIVETQSFNVSAGNNNIQLTIPSGVAAGNCYLRIISEDKKQRQLFRVVKQ